MPSRRVRSDSLARLRAETYSFPKGSGEDKHYGVQARRRVGEPAGAAVQIGSPRPFLNALTHIRISAFDLTSTDLFFVKGLYKMSKNGEKTGIIR